MERHQFTGRPGWPSLSQVSDDELLLCGAVAPLVSADIRAELPPTVFYTDNSEHGSGVLSVGSLLELVSVWQVFARGLCPPDFETSLVCEYIEEMSRRPKTVWQACAHWYLALAWKVSNLAQNEFAKKSLFRAPGG